MGGEMNAISEQRLIKNIDRVFAKCVRTLGCVLAATLVAVFGITPMLHATTLARMSLSQMASAADLVVRARCVTSASGWAQGSIWTVTQFDVLETLKGTPQAHVQVRLPGGHVGHFTMNVEAAPRFQPGEEGVFFLEKTSEGNYSVTSWAQGTFRIAKNAGAGEATVTQDSSAMNVFDAATRQFRSEGIRNLPLTQFRQRLLSALAAGNGR